MAMLIVYKQTNADMYAARALTKVEDAINTATSMAQRTGEPVFLLDTEGLTAKIAFVKKQPVKWKFLDNCRLMGE